MTSAEAELNQFVDYLAAQHPEDVDHVVEMTIDFMHEEEDRIERYVTENVKLICSNACFRRQNYLRRQMPKQSYYDPERTAAREAVQLRRHKLLKETQKPDILTLKREQEVRQETEQHVRRDIELDHAADEIVSLATNRQSDSRVTQKRNGKLKVNMAPVLTNTLKEGESRAEIRRRLKGKISAKLAEHGWVAEGSDVYSHEPDHQT